MMIEKRLHFLLTHKFVCWFSWFGHFHFWFLKLRFLIRLILEVRWSLGAIGCISYIESSSGSATLLLREMHNGTWYQHFQRPANSVWICWGCWTRERVAEPAAEGWDWENATVVRTLRLTKDHRVTTQRRIFPELGNNMKIDVHTHILPKTWPNLKQVLTNYQ